MPVDQVRNSLWTPDGERALVERDVIPVQNAMERVTFARMHEIAQRYGISLVCKRCDSSIEGKNNGHDAVPSVSCKCREWRFVA